MAKRTPSSQPAATPESITGMLTGGFHSEWITIGNHRILLECRGGFPNAEMRFIAKVAAVTCDHHSRAARVVKVYFNDKLTMWDIEVASTVAQDKELEEVLRTVLHTMRNDGNCQPQVKIVPKGNEDSDNYVHTEHVSVQAGVAVDRWRSDEDYQKKIEPPR